MSRTSLATTLFTCALCAAPPPSQIPDEFSDFVRWLPGRYETLQQATLDEQRGSAYKHVKAVLKIQLIDAQALGFPAGQQAFYLEQALADQAAQPYRQRVLVLERTGTGTATLWDYRITDPKDLVGADAAALRSLTKERLSRQDGCEVTWVRADRELYKGSAGAGRSCHTTLRNATFVISYSDLTPQTLTSLDEGFDDTGAHRWGPPPGVIGHIFRKQTEPAH